MSLPINWVSSLLVIGVMVPNYWVVQSQGNFIFLLIKNFIINELKPLISLNKIIIFYTVFLYILINNILGLIPYVFTSSTHRVFGLSLALPVWIFIIGFSLARQPMYFLSHLLPKGTPPILQPFIVLIEIIRNVIRPLTLTIRLTANIIAGHLLLTLIGSRGSFSRFLLLRLVIRAIILITTLELGVACIQAYVFAVRRTLYIREIDTQFLKKM